MFHQGNPLASVKQRTRFVVFYKQANISEELYIADETDHAVCC